MNTTWFAVGAVIVIQGVIIGWLFKNPFPCTISGCGCHDVWEMLHDTWSNLYLCISFILGVSMMLKNLGVKR